MSAPSRSRWMRLRYFLSKRTHLRISLLGVATMLAAHWEERRILIRNVPEGFAASFLCSHSKRRLQAYWQEEAGWQPDTAFRRLTKVARWRPVDLVLSELALTQTVKLPKAALTNLSEAIAYGLPSWSPFEADEVYASGSVDEVQSEQVKVCIRYALRAKADPLISRLGAAGLPPDRIVLDVASNQVIALPTAKMARLRKARRIDTTLTIAAAFLALLLSSIWVMVLSRRLEETQSLLRVELAQVRQTETLQMAYASLAARRAAVSERRANEVSAYEMLVTLAQDLPEDTFVQALELDGGHVRMDLSVLDLDTTSRALHTIPILRNVKIQPSGSHSMAATFELVRKKP